MIKVIKKTADILGLISRNGSGNTLGELCKRTGLKKPGLLLILKSLAELELVSRDADGLYAIGPRLVGIARPAMQGGILAALAHEHARALADRLGEYVKIVTLRGTSRIALARAEVDRTVIVRGAAVVGPSVYESATGRVLLAGLPTEKLGEIVKTHGWPTGDWKAVRSLKALRGRLAKIAAAKLAEVKSGDGQARYIAVPIRCMEKAVIAAVGVAVPENRMVVKRRREIIAELRRTAGLMEEELRLQGV